MSKNNNMNPGQYYDGDRNHQGEGIVQEDHKERLRETEKREGKEGEKNFIPGEKPAGEKKSAQ